MVNVPLAAGSGGDEFRAAVRERWLPALDAHRPQLILISAGFDAHREDPLAGLQFVEADYAWVTRELVAVAERHAQGRDRVAAGRRLCAVGARAAAPPNTCASCSRPRPVDDRAQADGAAAVPHDLCGLERRRHSRARRRARGRAAALVCAHAADRRPRPSVRARDLAADTNYVFQYPFAATPCLLVKLSRPAAATAT